MKYAMILVLAWCGAVMAGCTDYRHLRVEPIGKAKSAVIEPAFKETYYRVDRDGNYYFVLSSPTKGRGSDPTVQQVVVMRVFWRPVGGKTTLNPAALNATWRYTIVTPTTVALYEGAGFVTLQDKAGKSVMRARIVDGDMHLTESSAKFNDNIGRAVFHGNFTANLSNEETMERALQARRDFFLRSFRLAYPGAKDATTMPVKPSTTEPIKLPDPFELPTPGWMREPGTQSGK